MRFMMNGVAAVLVAAYPLAVYFGIQYVEPWMFAVLLILVLSARLSRGFSKQPGGRLLWVAGLIYCVLAVWRNDVITLRFYPVLVNALMLLIFSLSLSFPPPVIERLARLKTPDLPQSGVLYTRRVTQVWCLFFLVNGGIAFSTALWCSFEWWSLYNGLIAYALMGTLMAGEYLVRMRSQKHVR